MTTLKNGDTAIIGGTVVEGNDGPDVSGVTITKVDPALADIEDRLQLLRRALRADGRLDDKAGLTVEGHIRSAITKLERQRDEIRRKR